MADGQYTNPLTAADFDRIQRMRQMISATKPLVERCERCGLEMAGQRATLEAFENFAQNVEREFFPNGLPLT